MNNPIDRGYRKETARGLVVGTPMPITVVVIIICLRPLLAVNERRLSPTPNDEMLTHCDAPHPWPWFGVLVYLEQCS